jgi:hypothetical protein
LKGDWQLKIRFTYQIRNITTNDAKAIALVADKQKGKDSDSDNDSMSDPIVRALMKC